MSENGKLLDCGNCNQKTQHRRLSASEIEAQQQQKSSLKFRVLSIVFDVLLGSHKSDTLISYYQCTVCGSEYNDDESLPHGWG